MQHFADLTARFLHSGWFCFCIPVRAGFVLITVLSFLLSGTISVIIWFEVYNSYQLSASDRVAFILTGVVESLLCLASTIGFIGVIARKQLFAMIYAYFLYVHFVINVAVGIYFLVTVRASNRQELVDDCARVFEDTSVESKCARLMGISTYVFIAIVAVLLSLEFYGVVIATRYVYRLRKEKRDGRSRRLGYFHALSQPESLGWTHARQASDDIELLQNVDQPGGLEDVILDIRRQNYIPVSTYDGDLSPFPGQVPSQASSHSLADTTSSGRRVRALPPRPNTGPPDKDAVGPDSLPNPHEPSRGRAARRLDSEDGLSTTAHSALMDHATYIAPVFSRAKPR